MLEIPSVICQRLINHVPKVDADHSGTIDGREAAQLLGKSGLTREQLKTVWELADKNDKGELDHEEWAIAMHLSRQGELENEPQQQCNISRLHFLPYDAIYM